MNPYKKILSDAVDDVMMRCQAELNIQDLIDVVDERVQVYKETTAYNSPLLLAGAQKYLAMAKDLIDKADKENV